MPKKPLSDKIWSIAVPVADLTNDTTDGHKIGRRDSQLLYGEVFIAERRERVWLYGTSELDGYKGHIHQSALQRESKDTTHVVDNLMTGLYGEPDFKTRPVATLSFMSRISVESQTEENGFAKTSGGWIYKTHLKEISELKKNKDPVEAAIKFIGCPYLYGGRSALGIDCSGLVQLALNYCAISCPRDTDQQISVGKKITPQTLAHGDLVFFKGHVGLMTDPKNILNATARTMDVRIEKLSTLEKAYGGIIEARRL